MTESVYPQGPTPGTGTSPESRGSTVSSGVHVTTFPGPRTRTTTPGRVRQCVCWEGNSTAPPVFEQELQGSAREASHPEPHLVPGHAHIHVLRVFTTRPDGGGGSVKVSEALVAGWMARWIYSRLGVPRRFQGSAPEVSRYAGCSGGSVALLTPARGSADRVAGLACQGEELAHGHQAVHVGVADGLGV